MKYFYPMVKLPSLIQALRFLYFVWLFGHFSCLARYLA